MRVPGGTAGAPGYGFIEAPDSGIWIPATNQVGVATAGVSRWEWRSGHYIPVIDNTYDIGDTTHSVRDVYLDGQVKGDGEFVKPVSFGGFADFTGTTTNPGGRTFGGVYVVHGKKLTLWCTATLTSVGSGQYDFLIPGSVDGTNIPGNMPLGAWQASIGGVLTGGTVRRQAANSMRCTIPGGGTFGSAQGMASGDTLRIIAEYLVA